MSSVSEQIASNQRFSLLELLDRLLDKGVVVKGEVLLSVADVDLVYLNLGLLLSSVKAVEQAASRGGAGARELIAGQTSAQQAYLDESHVSDEPQCERAGKDEAPARVPMPVQASKSSQRDTGGTAARSLPSFIEDGLDQLFQPKTSIDPEKVEKGLTRLVLTLVDLVRKLMEKQAIRRIEAGQLNAGEIERVGNTFFLLDERMEQLKTTFGLQDEDLNLDLGPLGTLM